MMDEPIWVLDEAVTQIHRLQIQTHGGGEGIRDPDLLESALHRPKHLYSYMNNEVTLYQLAAAYAFGIARNHPFLDGNKRTAFVVSLLFLKLNNCQVIASQDDKYQTFLSLAAGRLTEQQLAEWFSSHARHPE
jgi:death-on-curing protein